MNKHSLQQLQAEFISGLFDDAAREDFASHVVSDSVSNNARVDIYRQSVAATLCLALTDTYPACQQLVGEDYFYQLAQTYHQAHPSRTPDLNVYVQAFPEYVAQHAVIAHCPYLADVATLEVACEQAYYGVNCAGLDFQALGRAMAQHGDQIIFRLPANAALIASDYPIECIWQMAMAPEQYDDVDITQGGCKLLVWRDAQGHRLEKLTDPQWQLLQVIAQSVTMAQLCQQLNDDVDFEQTLQDVVKLGAIDSFTIKEES